MNESLVTVIEAALATYVDKRIDAKLAGLAGIEELIERKLNDHVHVYEHFTETGDESFVTSVGKIFDAKLDSHVTYYEHFTKEGDEFENKVREYAASEAEDKLDTHHEAYDHDLIDDKDDNEDAIREIVNDVLSNATVRFNC